MAPAKRFPDTRMSTRLYQEKIYNSEFDASFETEKQTCYRESNYIDEVSIHLTSECLWSHKLSGWFCFFSTTIGRF